MASKADTYANARLNIFFPGRNNQNTNAPDSEGQCVSLVKWYLGEVCGITNWYIARGHAKDFGDTLVAQGLAIRVNSPISGDIAVWKQDGGGYGHIGVICDNGLVFEENVHIAGVKSKNITINGDTWTVYASRKEFHYNASWRKGPATFYRVIQPTPYPDKTDLELATMVWENKLGKGQARKDLLGSRYDAVQALVNSGQGKPSQTIQPSTTLPETPEQPETPSDTPQEPVSDDKPEDDKLSNSEPKGPETKPEQPNNNKKEDNMSEETKNNVPVGVSEEDFAKMQEATPTEITPDGWKPVIPDKIRLIVYLAAGIGSPLVALVYNTLAIYGIVDANLAIQMVTVVGTFFGSIAGLFGLSHFTKSK